MRVWAIFFITLVFFIAATRASAQEGAYSTRYDFNFYFDQNTDVLDVALDITLSNLRSDVYITEYTLRLPKHIDFKNLRVSDDFGKIPYVTSQLKNAKQITFKFGEPETGRSINTLKLQYSLDNMRVMQGSIQEAILPLIDVSEQGTVNVSLHLPKGFDQAVSISKPIPTNISYGVITWEDVKEKAILVLFGESQVYEVQLRYSLQNNGIVPKKQTIALPPETLYQKNYVQTLQPQPDRTFTDDDGNFLAEYTLLPRSSKDITYKGYVEVFVKPQSTLRDVMRRMFETQEDFLLTEHKLWSLGTMLAQVPSKDLRSAYGIYSYILEKLEYAPSRLRQKSQRFGAERALIEPQNAVCTEYSDLFIALAREKGIPAREIEGYAYSVNDQLRPLSLAKDLLHAWPEYYDRQQEIWRQVDPTWEDTSGINYFSGFDVNHIALAIHGKDPKMPLPAGFYKTEDRKDETVKITDDKPTSQVNLDMRTSIREILTSGQSYTDTVTVTNNSNTYIHSIQIVPQASNIVFDPPSLSVSFLAPYETKTYPFTYRTTDQFEPTDTISFTYAGSVLGTEIVRIIKQQSRDALIIGGSFVGIIVLLLLYFKMRSMHA